MYESVRTAFPKFSTLFEGRVAWMYLDVEGLVTIGVGNLIDPVTLATNLPFKHNSDGAPATVPEIVDEWNRIKGTVALAKQGYRAAKAYCRLHLDEGDIDNLVRFRLDQNETFLKRTFPGWSTFPADAQLAIHSMAWAMGAGFTAKFPAFTKAVQAQDWTLASKNCLMRTTGNPGLVPRNRANMQAFNEAAMTKASGIDPSILRSFTP